MRIVVVIVLAVLALVAVGGGASSSSSQRPDAPAPEYTIDLGLSPEDRWTEVVGDFRAVFPEVQRWINATVPLLARELLGPVFTYLDSQMGDFGQEIKGIASASGLSLYEVVALNLVYDLSAGCTSVVAQPAVGGPVHLRNLDYPMDWLLNLTAVVHFVDSSSSSSASASAAEEPLYSCVTFVGYAGCLTGVRKGAFSVSVDERDDGSSLLDNIYMLLKGGHSIGWTLRQFLETQTTYAAATAQMETVSLMAPVYLIVAGAGKNEGNVITRNRTAVVHGLYPLDPPTNWYRLETNYDLWGPVPSSDPRRTVGDEHMNRLTPATASIDTIYDVLSVPPVLNKHTRYTATMIPQTGLIECMVRWNAPQNVTYAGPVRSWL